MSPNVYTAGNSATVFYTFSNPSSNTYAVSQYTLSIPSGWTVQYCDTYSGPFDCTVSSSAVTYYESTTGAGLNPGASQQMSIHVVFATGASYPVTGKFSTQVQLASSAAFSAGPSFNLYAVDTTSLTLTPNGAGGTNTYVAGSGPIKFTATLDTAYAGLPVTFTTAFQMNDGYYTSTTALGSFSTPTVNTGSSGTASDTFTPSNLAGTTTVYAYLGNPWISPTSLYHQSVCCYTYYDASPAVAGTTSIWGSNVDYSYVTTVPGTPSSVSFTDTNVGSFPTSANDYLTSNAAVPNGGSGNNMAYVAGSTFSVSVTDKYTNPISFTSITSPTISITATSGGGLFNGPTSTGGTNETTVTYAAGGVSATGTVLTNYYQSGTYGSVGILAATIGGTLNSAPFTVAGNSGSLITSTFDTSVSGTYTCTVACPGSLTAGNTETVAYQLTTPQKGVPVTFFAVNGTSPYVGSWVGGSTQWDSTSMAYNVTGTTNSQGIATEKFTISTDAITPATVTFYVNVAAPTNTLLTNYLAGSGSPTGAITTTAGPAASFIVTAYFDNPPTAATTHALSNSTLYVDASLVDAYGNPASNTGVVQIQVDLSASAGTLSAHTVYIAPTQSDTYSSFGSIEWATTNIPIGSTITLTASAVVAGNSVTGSTSVTIVSPNPTLTASSTTGTTVSGVVYSSVAAVSFTGTATVSNGYAPAMGVDFATTTNGQPGVWYKIDSGSWILASTGTSPLTWSAAVIFSSGLHTISFMANDSEGNASPTTTFSVLIDTAAPNINFLTPANANISLPGTVSANIVDTMGDVNTTSVTAVGTNLATSATTTLTTHVTGTGNPGHQTTYGVTISGLTTGNWSIVLSATDYAGNVNSSTITVHVLVPFAQSFVISGTPHTATIGSFAGINASYTNLNPTSQSVVVFAVFKNSVGQTIGIGTGSVTVGAGATQSVFIAEPVGLPSGTYTVNIFVFTTGNLPVSAQTTISVTV